MQCTKSPLTSKLAVYITDQPVPDSEMQYCTTLNGHRTGKVSDIAKCIGLHLRSRMTDYHTPLALSSHKTIVCQDRYFCAPTKGYVKSERMGAIVDVISSTF